MKSELVREKINVKRNMKRNETALTNIGAIVASGRSKTTDRQSPEMSNLKAARYECSC